MIVSDRNLGAAKGGMLESKADSQTEYIYKNNLNLIKDFLVTAYQILFIQVFSYYQQENLYGVEKFTIHNVYY